MIESLSDLIDAGELVFHFPLAIYGAPTDDVQADSVKLCGTDSGDDSEYAALHRQLICWCLIERFWYSVLNMPQVLDFEYDMIEQCVKKIENDLGIGLDNRYSPCRMVGSSDWKDYPRSIIGIFSASKSFRRAIGWRTHKPYMKGLSR